MSTAPVSAIVATHDRPELLRRAIRSIAAQEIPIGEVIVVYDGSQPDYSLVGEFPDAPVRRDRER